jgi:hypothetical protein
MIIKNVREAIKAKSIGSSIVKENLLFKNFKSETLVLNNIDDCYLILISLITA